MSMVTVSDKLKVWVDENPEASYEEIMDQMRVLMDEEDNQANE